jgi:hypothetical protein
MPQSQRLPQQRGPLRRVPPAPPAGHQRAEPVRVHGFRIDLDRIATIAGQQPDSAVTGQRPPQPRHVAVQLPSRRGAGFAVPQQVEQPVDVISMPARSSSKPNRHRSRRRPSATGTPPRSASTRPSSRNIVVPDTHTPGSRFHPAPNVWVSGHARGDIGIEGVGRQDRFPLPHEALDLVQRPAQLFRDLVQLGARPPASPPRPCSQNRCLYRSLDYRGQNAATGAVIISSRRSNRKPFRDIVCRKPFRAALLR